FIIGVPDGDKAWASVSVALPACAVSAPTWQRFANLRAFESHLRSLLLFDATFHFLGFPADRRPSRDFLDDRPAALRVSLPVCPTGVRAPKRFLRFAKHARRVRQNTHLRRPQFRSSQETLAESYSRQL